MWRGTAVVGEALRQATDGRRRIVGVSRQEHRAILIVGGGFAGVAAAMAASSAAAVRGALVDVEVVNATEWMTLRPRLYESDLSATRVHLPDLLAERGVALRVGTVEVMAPAAGMVSLGDGTCISFDRLVLAAGSRLRAPDLGDRVDLVHDVDTYEAALALQTHLRVVATASERVEVLVVGAGLTGLEVATELADRLPRQTGRRAEDIHVTLVDCSSSLDQLVGAQPADIVAAALLAARVDLVLGRRLVAVDGDGAVLDDGSRLGCSTVVWTSGLSPSPLTDQLSGERDASGRIRVDEFLRAPGHPNVFIAGDVAAAPTGDGRTTVMSCQHAMPMDAVAGRNAVRSLTGDPLSAFLPSPYVTCIDLGASGGLLTSGWDREPVFTGAEGKAVKRSIMEMIHPASWSF